jgi:exopolyphosphatase / guanosine-5'-triphosphate,3'-diphosphate pyrophosphatase
MRMGVLDAGSNTVHLAVVDGDRGRPPLPVVAVKQRLRLAQRIDSSGAIDDEGVQSLIECIRRALYEADRYRVDELYAFATAAIRDSPNAAPVLARVHQETGLRMMMLPGEEEARLTFLAARRWFGWSAGALMLLDIGGGSAEVAWGTADEPAFAVSMPLGAGRLTRTWLTGDPPEPAQVKRMTRHIKEHVGALADRVQWECRSAHPVGTSRTFQQLAQLCGAPARRQGPFTSRRLRASDLAAWIPRLARMTEDQRAKLSGISRTRARQSLAGAIVACRLMKTLDVDEVEVCPWALREGVLLHRLDAAGGGRARLRPAAIESVGASSVDAAPQLPAIPQMG